MTLEAVRAAVAAPRHKVMIASEREALETARAMLAVLAKPIGLDPPGLRQVRLDKLRHSLECLGIPSSLMDDVT